jgi:uncharacterized membrane protein
MSQSPDPEAPAELPPPTAERAEPVAAEPLVAPAPRRRWWRRLRPAMRARDLAVFLRGALLLTITGLCLAAFVLQLTGTFRVRSLWKLGEFVSSNQIATRARMQMLGWLGAGGAAGGLWALALYRWRARRRSAAGRAARVLRAGRLFWPLMLPSLAWSLVAATGWDPLSRISGIACVAILSEVCVRGAVSEVLGGRLAFARVLARAAAAASRAFARSRPFAPPAGVVVLVASAFYAVWMSWGTILQHRHFGTAAFDLGNYDTMFFNALHGRPFRCPPVFPKGASWSMLGTHAELTMFALLPFYALRPGAETLLVLQAVALASGAIPLYRFAARRLPRAVALVLALAYLLYAPLHEANFYDVHFPPFAAAFTLWAVDLLDARRPLWFALFFALALGCREDVAIGFAVLGVYLLVRGKHTRATIVMTIVSVAYFVVIKVVVMPRFEGPSVADAYPTGEATYGGAVKMLLANPLFFWKTLITLPKIALFLLVLSPLAFLPLRRALLWMSLLPAVPLTLLASGYDPTIQLSFQYVLLYAPFLFLASALALAAFRGAPNGRARLAGAIGGIAMATFLTTRVWGAMPPGDQCSGGFRDIPALRPVSAAEKQKAQDIAELDAKVPKDAVLAATEMEYPHISTRLDGLTLRNGYDGADFILYSDDGDGAETGRRALASGAYELVERRPASRMSLLRRKKK